MVPSNYQFKSRLQKRRQKVHSFNSGLMLRWLGPELSRTLAFLLSLALFFSNLSFSPPSAHAVQQSIGLQAAAISETEVRLYFRVSDRSTIGGISIYRAVGEGNNNYQF